MDSTEIPAAIGHARAAAQAVRALNHATLWVNDTDGYQQPADVDAAVAELAALAGMLPQALDQAGEWILRRYENGQIGHDADGSVRVEATCSLISLNAAAMAAARLHTALARVQNHTSHLTGEPRGQHIDQDGRQDPVPSPGEQT
jgi:hypothetical protein